MKIIGLTGPTGAGKTTALQELEKMGFTIVDCDALYYTLLREDEKLRQELTGAFGQIFSPDGQLNRQSLGKLVFGDQNAMARLNAIVFPAVNAAVGKIISACRGQGVVVDAINLIECGLGEQCDLTVAITAPQEIRLRRIIARDGIDESYARRRIASQKKDGYYRKHCTFLLENRAGSKGEFQQLIREFFSEIEIITNMEE